LSSEVPLPRPRALTASKVGRAARATRNMDIPSVSWRIRSTATDPRVVEIMTREAPDAIQELVYWGCDFARTGAGKIDQPFLDTTDHVGQCRIAASHGLPRAVQWYSDRSVGSALTWWNS
jgi:hypothetical protein